MWTNVCVVTTILLTSLTALVYPLAEASGPVAVFKAPSSGNAFRGGSPLLLREEVAIVTAPGLGAFDLDLQFNASVLSVTISEGEFLSSTGNATECTASYPSLAQIHFSCITTGSPTTGAVGQGALAVLEVWPRAAPQIPATSNNAIFTVIVDVSVHLWDVSGTEIVVANLGDAIVAARTLESDLNTDCFVNVIDLQLISGHFPSEDGDPAYVEAFDLQPPGGDGDIDLIDMQFVYGRIGSTCDAPIPAQLPPFGPTTVIPPTLTPAPAASVGGIAEAVDPATLPTANPPASASDWVLGGLTGSIAVLALAGLVRRLSRRSTSVPVHS